MLYYLCTTIMLEPGQRRNPAAIITSICVCFFYEVIIMFMQEAINEANLALNTNDIPIGAVVVFNNEIIGRGHNLRYRNIDVTNHAEIIAIKEAAKTLGDWRLNNCDLYVTLEPCEMCMEVIRESRIKNVYFLIEKDKKEKYQTNKCLYNKSDVNSDDYKKILVDFFVDNCNR